jgi:hypothetical protein
MNSSSIKLFVDDSGRPRALATDADPRLRLLATALETDLQDPSYCQRILNEARRLARTRGASRWKNSGNAYSVSIGPRCSLIRSLHPAADSLAYVALPTPEWVALIRRWLSLL